MTTRGARDGIAVSRAAVIAIDGPSGSGKSTVARQVAQRLHLRYLDTGAMYRAVTWQALADGLDAADGSALAAALTPERLDRLDLVVGTAPRRPGISVGGTDLATAIRSDEVTRAVSAVSALPAVRGWLVARQRELIGAGGIVVEGRDIGTTVAPEASVKVFLTASGTARAVRRHRQETPAEDPAELARTHAELERRDRLDSTRAASPLVRAPDAVEIDSTHLGVSEVVAAVLAECRRAGIVAPRRPAGVRTSA